MHGLTGREKCPVRIGMRGLRARGHSHCFNFPHSYRFGMYRDHCEVSAVSVDALLEASSSHLKMGSKGLKLATLRLVICCSLTGPVGCQACVSMWCQESSGPLYAKLLFSRTAVMPTTSVTSPACRTATSPDSIPGMRILFVWEQ